MFVLYSSNKITKKQKRNNNNWIDEGKQVMFEAALTYFVGKKKRKSKVHCY